MTVSTLTIVLLAVTAILWLFYHQKKINSQLNNKNLPPLVPYYIPFIGSLISYGMNPVKFIEENRKKYGDYFTFLMFGRLITHCLGIEGNESFFNAKHSIANAEDAYKSLTKPVFGPGVVYDVPNHVLMEQKRFVKSGLTTENLKSYPKKISKELKQHLELYMNEKQGKICAFATLSQLIIKTASACLLGREIRSRLDDTVAQLYHDLDKGFTPLHFLFTWLPLPSYYNRDKAHLKMRSLFMGIIKERKTKNTKSTTRGEHDMIEALLGQKYKSGSPLSDMEIAHILIALLMAGQHTSSTTTTWALMYIAQDQKLQERLYEEQKELFGVKPSSEITYEDLENFTSIHNCLKETLRLRPPIIELMRKTTAPFAIPNTKYIIPKGYYIAASPVITHRSAEMFEAPEQFDINRWDTSQNTKSHEETIETDLGFGKMKTTSAKSPYLPFGAGRHRCIGETFAYVQIKMILLVIVRNYRIELDKKFPEVDFSNLIALPCLPATIKYYRRNEEII